MTDTKFWIVKNFLGSISPKITQKLKITLFDVIDLDKIRTVHSMGENIFQAMGESERSFGLEFRTST